MAIALCAALMMGAVGCPLGQQGAAGAFPPQLPIVPQPAGPRAGRLPASVDASPAGGGAWRAEFSFKPDSPVGSVHLAGDFNGWNAQATPLTRGDDGIWRVSLLVPEGERSYKFVVDGARWLPDPRNPDRADDGYGGSNSILRLGALANLDPASAQRNDGKIEPSALAHDPALAAFLQASGSDGAIIRYRALAGDLRGVTLVAEGREPVPMRQAGTDGAFEWWEAALADAPDGLAYTFVLHADARSRFRDATVHTLSRAALNAFRTPEWAKDAIWYQVMVDRFRNGDPANDPPQVRPWTSSWYVPSPWEGKDGETFYNFYVFRRMYGGDITGLRSKLPYLRDLGVNALYLNPVFQAEGHHKYNASSYIHIDDGFGTRGDTAAAEAREDLREPSTWTFTPTDRAFLDFLKEAKGMGFRVIIDGVFNHVGTAHSAFRDVKARGAASPYKDWFAVRSFDPFVYDGWAGFGDLPVFAKNAEGFACEAVKQHLFDITRRWMDPDGDGDPSDGIDGWRLDVPNEVAMPFWREWRRLVKSINPDALIVGEVWRRADDWLDGTTLDAVMSYPFADTAIRWIGDRVNAIPPSEVDRRLAELRRAYPREASLVVQNLLDSHDTDRLVSKMFNPDREFDRGNREQETPEYNGDKPTADEYRKARLAALLQMTSLGAPMIYYGDEVGMWGSDDPNNRKPMLWGDLGAPENPQDIEDPEHLAWYRRIIALRRAHPALRRGGYELLVADDRQDTLAFLREIPGGERAVVALNASEKPVQIRVAKALGTRASGEWRLAFGGVDPVGEAAARLDTIELAPLDGKVWVQSP